MIDQVKAARKVALVFTLIYFATAGSIARAETCHYWFNVDSVASVQEIPEGLIERIHRRLDLVNTLAERKGESRFEKFKAFVLDEPHKFPPNILAQAIEKFRITQARVIKLDFFKRFSFQVPDEDLVEFLDQYFQTNVAKSASLKDFEALVNSVENSQHKTSIVRYLMATKRSQGIKLGRLLVEIESIETSSYAQLLLEELFKDFFSKYTLQELHANIYVFAELFLEYPSQIPYQKVIEKYSSQMQKMDYLEILEAINVLEARGFPNVAILKVYFYLKKSNQKNKNIADYSEFLKEYGLTFGAADYLAYVVQRHEEISGLEIIVGAISVGLMDSSTQEIQLSEKYELWGRNYRESLSMIIGYIVHKRPQLKLSWAESYVISQMIVSEADRVTPGVFTLKEKNLRDLMGPILKMNDEEGSWDAFFKIKAALNLSVAKLVDIAIEVGAGEFLAEEYIHHFGLLRSHGEIVERIRKNRMGLLRGERPRFDLFSNQRVEVSEQPKSNRELFNYGQLVFDEYASLMLTLAEAQPFAARVSHTENQIIRAIENFRAEASKLSRSKKFEAFRAMKLDIVRNFRATRADVSYVYDQWIKLRAHLIELQKVNELHLEVLKRLREDSPIDLDFESILDRETELAELDYKLIHSLETLAEQIDLHKRVLRETQGIIENFASMNQDQILSSQWKDILFAQGK